MRNEIASLSLVAARKSCDCIKRNVYLTAFNGVYCTCIIYFVGFTYFALKFNKLFMKHNYFALIYVSQGYSYEHFIPFC